MLQSFENSCMELVHGRIGAKINISPGSVEDRSQWPRKQWNLPLSLTGSAGGLNWQHEEQYYLKAVLFSLWYMWHTSRQHAALAATRGSQGDELRPAHSNDRGTTIRPLLGWKYKRTPFLSPLSELIGHFISELHVHEFIYGTVPVPADRAADCPVLLAYGEKKHSLLLEYLDCAEIATEAINTYREKVNKFRCRPRIRVEIQTAESGLPFLSQLKGFFVDL